MKEQLDSYSTREKNLWFNFLVDIAVALYYWPKAISLMLAGDAALRGSAMVGLITSTVILAIVVSGALSIFLHAQQKPEPMDERDHLIEARGSLLASRVLVACVLAIIGHAVVQELALNTAPGQQWLTFLPLGFSPLIMAHLLLVALMLWSMTSSVARLYYYRRGY